MSGNFVQDCVPASGPVRVDYAVVTYGPEGISRVASMLLPPAPGVRYVVSWQNHDGAPVPDALERPDVLVVRTSTRGISLNRNNALSHCDADIVIFADDDLTLYPGAPDAVREAYARHPEAQVITFRSDHGDPGRFPLSATRLGRRLPKGYSVASFEITMRGRAARILRCCPEMGVGAPSIHGGEDELILWTALRNGLETRFEPAVICAHPHPSTGLRDMPAPGNLRAIGCAIALMYPLTAPLRIPLKIWRLWRDGKGRLPSVALHIAAGALKAPGIYFRNRDIFNIKTRE
ncbi:MAG: glycosyltransferase family 2 protein [Muribaculaceae bacterium]|nr:glycosyltransferase family 2 protein [Muribaculaceae bacterium]